MGDRRWLWIGACLLSMHYERAEAGNGEGEPALRQERPASGGPIKGMPSENTSPCRNTRNNFPHPASSRRRRQFFFRGAACKPRSDGAPVSLSSRGGDVRHDEAVRFSETHKLTWLRSCQRW